MSGRRFWVALGGNWAGEMMIRAPQLAIDLLVMRMLSDSQLGVWVGLRAALQLASSLASIPLSGLDLEYSYAMGKVDPERARRTAGSALFAVLGMTILTVLVLLPGVFSSRFRHALVQGASQSDFTAFLVFVALQGVYNFFITHLRNQLRFLHVNAVVLTGSCLTVGMVMLLTPRFGVWGILAAYGLSYTLCSCVWLRWSDMQWSNFSGTKSMIHSLCVTGATLAAVTVAISGLRLISRWFVGQQLGETAVGQYGVAATVAGAVLLAGSATSRVIMQFAARAVGAEMNRQDQTTQFALLPGIAIAGAGGLACIGVVGFAQWLIPIWAPQHSAAINVMRPVLYGSLALGVALVMASTLRAQSRQKELLAACGGASLLQLGLLCLGSWWGTSLLGFASLEVVSFLSFMFVLLALLDCQIRQRLVFAACVSSALALCAISIESSIRWSSPDSLWALVKFIVMACGLFAPWLLFGVWTARSMLKDAKLAEAASASLAASNDAAPSNSQSAAGKRAA